MLKLGIVMHVTVEDSSKMIELVSLKNEKTRIRLIYYLNVDRRDIKADTSINTLNWDPTRT